jgi:hypothetical protein
MGVREGGGEERGGKAGGGGGGGEAGGGIQQVAHWMEMVAGSGGRSQVGLAWGTGFRGGAWAGGLIDDRQPAEWGWCTSGALEVGVD